MDLSRSPAADVSPTVSPDGNSVAFLSDRGGRGAAYVVGVNGRGLRRISPRLFPVDAGGLAAGSIVWSPDSHRVAMAASTGGGMTLYIGDLERHWKAVARIPGDGQATAWSPNGQIAYYASFEPSTPAWSADGRFLAYRRSRRLMVVGVPGGHGPHWHQENEVRVVDTSGRRAWDAKDAINPIWSRDGRLAVDTTDGVNVYDEYGRLLDSYRGRVLGWSPSGDRLATARNGRLEIREGGLGNPIISLRATPIFQFQWPEDRMIVVSHGSTAEAVDPWTGRRSRPRFIDHGLFSADRSHVAAVRGGPPGKYSRWTVAAASADASNMRVLARSGLCGSDSDAPLSSLQFAAAGRALVYQEACFSGPNRLYAVSLDGTHLRRVDRSRLDPADRTGIPPALSPDGRQVVYSRLTDPSCDKACGAALWLMDRDGTHRRQLTHPPVKADPTERDDGPSWSPDGRWIVFTRSTNRAPTTLFVVPAAGGRARSLHVTGSGPVWLGKRIAYMDENYQKIFTVSLRGGGKRRLARDKSVIGLARSSTGSLAYLGTRGTRITSGAVLRIIDPAGRATSFPLPVRASSLAWSPDGKRLLLSASRGSAPTDLFVVDANGRHFRRLTRNMGYIWTMGWLEPART